MRRPLRPRRRLLAAALIALLTVVAFAFSVPVLLSPWTSRATPAPARPIGVVSTTVPPVCDRDPRLFVPRPKPGEGYVPQPASSYDPEACR